MAPKEWPPWWHWELEISSHALKRMIDRRFSETDLRHMLEDATAWRPNVVEGRYEVATSLEGRAWEIIVEPLVEESLLLVITAYRVTP